MKRNLLTLIGFLLIFPAIAQITVTSDDLIGAGAIVVSDIDTTSLLSPGAGGAGQTWDFSAVVTQAYDTIWFMNPGSTPYPDAFPTANLAAWVLTDDMFVYFNSNTQELARIGGVWQVDELGGMTVTATITPKEVIAGFPMNYLDNYAESFIQQFKAPNPIPALGVDSVWIRIYTDKTTIVDAWGSITTPLGTFEALRVRENESIIDSVFGFMKGSWILLDVGDDIDESYSWWTDDPNIGFPVLEMSVDTESGFPDDISFLSQEPFYGVTEPILAQSAMVIFPNPARDIVNCQFSIVDFQYCKIALYNIHGKRVKDVFEGKTNQENIVIEVGHLPAGIYYVRMQAGNELVCRKMIIVRD